MKAAAAAKTALLNASGVTSLIVPMKVATSFRFSNATLYEIMQPPESVRPRSLLCESVALI